MITRDTRQAILEAGAELVHRQGFHNTGLSEILAAAQVPKGSFYHYFKSKEDFGLALVAMHVERLRERVAPLLADPEVTPLDLLRNIFESSCEAHAANAFEGGCPIGNLAQELSDLSPPMRQAVAQAMRGFAERFAGIIRRAVEAGQLGADIEPDETAQFVLDAWEGALLRMKAEKSVEPLLRFRRFLFDRVLRTATDRPCAQPMPLKPDPKPAP